MLVMGKEWFVRLYVLQNIDIWTYKITLCELDKFITLSNCLAIRALTTLPLTRAKGNGLKNHIQGNGKSSSLLQRNQSPHRTSLTLNEQVKQGNLVSLQAIVKEQGILRGSTGQFPVPQMPMVPPGGWSVQST